MLNTWLQPVLSCTGITTLSAHLSAKDLFPTDVLSSPFSLLNITQKEDNLQQTNFLSTCLEVCLLVTKNYLAPYKTVLLRVKTNREMHNFLLVPSHPFIQCILLKFNDDGKYQDGGGVFDIYLVALGNFKCHLWQRGERGLIRHKFCGTSFIDYILYKLFPLLLLHITLMVFRERERERE